MAYQTKDSTVTLRDIETGEVIREFKGDNKIIYTMAFSPDGLLFTSGGTSGKVNIWEVLTGKETIKIEKIEEYCSLIDMEFNTDGNIIALGNQLKIYIFDVKTGELIQKINALNSLDDFAYHHLGRYVATTALNGEGLLLWDAKTGKLIKRIGNDSTGYFYKIAFHPYKDIIACASYFGYLELYDINTGELIKKYNTGNYESRKIKFDESGNFLIFELDNEIQFINLENDEVIKILRGHYCEPYRGKFSMNKSGNLIAWDNFNQINFINPQDGEIVKKISDFKSEIINTAFSPSENIIAASMTDSTIKFFNLTTGNNTLIINVGKPISESLEFSPDGNLIAAGCLDSTVRFWNSANGKLIKTISLGKLKYNKVNFAFNPENKSVAVCMNDTVIYIWDLQSWLPSYTLIGHKSFICCIAYNRDGTLLASSSISPESKIILWNINDGEIIDSLRGQPYTIIFHPYLKYFVTGTRYTISFFEFDSLKEAFQINGHESIIPTLAITPNGSQLISSSWDGTLKIWDLSKFITNVEIERNNGNTNNYDLELIPNPVTNNLILRMSFECDFEPVIIISDILGRKIKIGTDNISFGNDNSITIYMSELNSGLYFLRYKCGDKVIIKIFQKL